MLKPLVLITGITSFIGTHVGQTALKSGYRIRGTSRSAEKLDRVRSYYKSKGYSESEFDLVVVPDVSVDGAFDTSLDGVGKVIHIASPLSKGITNFQRDLLTPAVKGTESILFSALKCPGIDRVVITSSIMAITNFSKLGKDHVVDEDEQSDIDVNTTNFKTPFHAYCTSKVMADKATVNFVAKYQPSFTVATIHPSFVLGKNATQQSKEPCSGTNDFLWQQFQGTQLAPLLGNSVHVQSVADAHVQALSVKIKASHSPRRYITGSERIEWKDAKMCAEKQFPSVDFSTFAPRETLVMRVDNSRSESELQVKFRSFEEQVVDVVGQQLELAG
jgi:nucleoside-diphosphate-sugar epimerase